MYPRGELDRLADRKMVLQARIAVRRWESAQAAAELARPLALADRALDVWRLIAPLVKLLAVPASLLLAKLLKSRRAVQGGRGGRIGMLLGALSAVIRGVKIFQQMRAARAAPAAKSGTAAAPV